MNPIRSDGGGLEPTLLGAAWRRKWLVLLFLMLGLGLAITLRSITPTAYAATATLVVQDPRGAGLAEIGGVQSPQRYLADQLVILRSPAVAVRAAEKANEEIGSTLFATDEFLIFTDVASSSAGNSIFITFVADSAERARIGTDAIAAAYQEVTREGTQESASAALERIDAAVSGIDDDLASIRVKIADLTVSDELRLVLDAQFLSSVAEVAELQGRQDTTTDPAELDRIRVRLNDINQRFSLLQTIRSVQASSAEVVALLREQDSAIERRMGLVTQRSQIEIDAELASSGVVLFSPAFEVIVLRGGLVRALAVGLILGSLSGVGLAYWLEIRRREFAYSFEPERVLAAPLLAEIHDLSEERVRSNLPVRTHRQSAAAEAFRFAANSLEVHAAPAGFRVLAFVSATAGAGKTFVVANTALAAAQQGSRVLVVDADFGDQALTRLLTDSGAVDVGMTDVVAETVSLRRAIQSVTSTGSSDLQLLSRGTGQITAPEFFRSAGARSLFDHLKGEFDLVLIDTPPILQVAYTSTLVSYADAAVVILEHESSVTSLEAVVDRLSLAGASVAGYVYNRAPLRAEMTAFEGSMKDVLGTGDESRVRSGRRAKPRRRSRPTDSDKG